MSQKEKYLENADNCIALAEKAKDAPSRARYKRMAESWLALAEEQDWLAGEVSPLPIGNAHKSVNRCRRR